MFRRNKDLYIIILETQGSPILTYCTMAIDVSQKSVHSFNVFWNMIYRRIFNFNKWELVSLFIADMGRLNFTYLYQWLQFEMLKNCVLHSAFVAIKMCLMYDINFIMPLHAINIALTEHFWSSFDLCQLKCLCCRCLSYFVLYMAFLL